MGSEMCIRDRYEDRNNPVHQEVLNLTPEEIARGPVENDVPTQFEAQSVTEHEGSDAPANEEDRQERSTNLDMPDQKGDQIDRRNLA